MNIAPILPNNCNYYHELHFSLHISSKEFLALSTYNTGSLMLIDVILSENNND